MASQTTSLTIVYSTVYSGADQRKHQSSASLALVRGIHRWPVNSPHKWPVTRKMFPFDDVIMRQIPLEHLSMWLIREPNVVECMGVIFKVDICASPGCYVWRYNYVYSYLDLYPYGLYRHHNFPTIYVMLLFSRVTVGFCSKKLWVVIMTRVGWAPGVGTPSVKAVGRLPGTHWLQSRSIFLAATKQLYEWSFPSVRHTFFTMFPSSYHPEIFRSYYQWQMWCPCKRSTSEVKGQGHRGHGLT